MYHSYTFLKLAGVIIHLKLFDKPVPPGVIVFTMFGLWAVASIVIMALLIGLGR
jgi:fumarate reductase subunit C